jgi:hypothetical protein
MTRYKSVCACGCYVLCWSTRRIITKCYELWRMLTCSITGERRLQDHYLYTWKTTGSKVTIILHGNINRGTVHTGFGSNPHSIQRVRGALSKGVNGRRHAECVEFCLISPIRLNGEVLLLIRQINNFYLHINIAFTLALDSIRPPNQWTRGPFSIVKGQRNADFKNVWNSTSILPYVFMASWLYYLDRETTFTITSLNL